MIDNWSRPAGGAFGAIVEGVNLRDCCTAEAMEDILRLFYPSRFIVFRGQDLKDSDYAAFASQWGRPIRFFWQNRVDQEHAEIINVDNSPSTPVEQRDSAVHWHSDSSYEAEPASVTMLYCLEAPLVGGATEFADTVAAYNALDADDRALVERLRIRHHLLSAPAIEGETLITPPPADDLVTDHVRPAVMRHPATGERAIYLSGTGCGVEGMDEGEGKALISRLRRHVIDSRFRSAYKLEAGDLIIWDNLSTVHSATPVDYSDEPGKRRILQRISLKGLPAVLETSPVI